MGQGHHGGVAVERHRQHQVVGHRRATASRPPSPPSPRGIPRAARRRSPGSPASPPSRPGSATSWPAPMISRRSRGPCTVASVVPSKRSVSPSTRVASVDRAGAPGRAARARRGGPRSRASNSRSCVRADSGSSTSSTVPPQGRPKRCASSARGAVASSPAAAARQLAPRDARRSGRPRCSRPTPSRPPGRRRGWPSASPAAVAPSPRCAPRCPAPRGGRGRPVDRAAQYLDVDAVHEFTRASKIEPMPHAAPGRSSRRVRAARAVCTPAPAGRGHGGRHAVTSASGRRVARTAGRCRLPRAVRR